MTLASNRHSFEHSIIPTNDTIHSFYRNGRFSDNRPDASQPERVTSALRHVMDSE